MSDGTDDTELRQRVAQLEDRIESQQDTIEKLMPSRRSVVAGALGLGAFGAGTRVGSQRASAQAAGQVGTDADPVDARVWDLDVQNGVTSDLPMNGNAVTGASAVETGQAVAGGIAMGDITSVTVSSGSVSISESDGYLVIDGEGGADDDLDTINGGRALQIIVLRRTNNQITVKDGTGNLNLVSDRVLAGNEDRLVLMKNFGDSTWFELSFADNS